MLPSPSLSFCLCFGQKPVLPTTSSHFSPSLFHNLLPSQYASCILSSFSILRHISLPSNLQCALTDETISSMGIYTEGEWERYRKVQLEDFTLLVREYGRGKVKRANRFVYLYNMLYLYLCHVRVEVYTTPLSLPPPSASCCYLIAHWARAENFIGRLKVISLEFMANALEHISIWLWQRAQLSLQWATWHESVHWHLQTQHATPPPLPSSRTNAPAVRQLWWRP